MTKEQLARWRELGFEFPDFYDTIAKDELVEVKIVNISFSKVEQDNAAFQKFLVKILLSSDPYNSKITAQIDDRQFTAYKKLDTIENINVVFADVFVDLSIPRNDEVFSLTIEVVDNFTKKTTDTKTVNIKVDNQGSVGETEENEDQSKNEVNSKPLVSITLDNLIDFGVSKKKATEYLDSLNNTFKDYNINTDLKVIHFLAQVIHESISFTATYEKGVSNSEYGGFKGRGLMQLTGKGNYEEYEEYEGEDFTSSIKNKEKLEKTPYSVRSAGWFWSVNAKLNELAEENDFIYITKIINGGYNHFDFRLQLLKKGYKIFGKDFKDFVFKDSKAYRDEKATFGWGLWHDPLLDKVGFVKNKDIAIEGYMRYLELAPEGKHVNWYKILSMNNFSKLKYKKDGKNFVNVIDVVKQQLKKLREL